MPFFRNNAKLSPKEIKETELIFIQKNGMKNTYNLSFSFRISNEEQPYTGTLRINEKSGKMIFSYVKKNSTNYCLIDDGSEKLWAKALIKQNTKKQRETEIPVNILKWL